MPTLFSKLRAWLPQQTRRIDGVSVRYRRGGTTETMIAVPGNATQPSQIDGGVVIDFGDRDYLIAIAELTTFGEPALGDRITETLNGVDEVYEVVTPGTGDKAWRWSGTGRTHYRIHTKKVA